MHYVAYLIPILFMIGSSISDSITKIKNIYGAYAPNFFSSP